MTLQSENKTLKRALEDANSKGEQLQELAQVHEDCACTYVCGC